MPDDSDKGRSEPPVAYSARAFVAAGIAIIALVGVILAAARGEVNTSLALIIGALAVAVLVALVGTAIWERSQRPHDGE